MAPRDAVAIALLLVGIVLGGGGSPLHDLAIELLSVLLLGLCVARGDSRPIVGSAWCWVAAGATLLVALVQLLPLSPPMWTKLPGRDLAAAISGLAGQDRLWRPLSLDPAATRTALLATLPPLAMFFYAASAPPAAHLRLQLLIVAGALASATLGALQVAAGESYYLYGSASRGFPNGFFSNHNHQADLLLVGIAILAARARALSAGRGMGSAATVLIGGALLMLVLGLFATGSRLGIALLLVPLLGALAAVRRLDGRAARLAILGAAVVVILGVALLAGNTVLQERFARFGLLGHDGRIGYWSDTVALIRQFWPAGSGLGTFVPLYASIEPLDTVDQLYVNHAHNDYLELVLETGIVGVALLLGYAIFLGRALFRRIGGALGENRGVAIVGVLVLLLHSVADYPLRTFSLSIIFALLNGMLLAPSAAPIRDETIGSPPVPQSISRRRKRIHA